MKTMNEIVEDFPMLRAEIKKELSLRKWNYGRLAKETGYSLYYIQSFMTGCRGSGKAALKIAKALGIPENLAIPKER